MEVSVGKKRGMPRAKNPNVIFIKVSDLMTDAGGDYTGFPLRAANNVGSSGNLALTVGAKALAIYMTPSTISRNDNSDGEGSGVGIISNFVGEHPGDDEAINQFLQEYLDEDVLILTKECSTGTGTRLQGTPCNPMKLTFEGQDNNEGVKKTITFTQAARHEYVMMHYSGTMPELLPYTADPGSDDSGI